MRQRSGASDVDFDQMPVDDYLSLVRDQAEHVTGLGALGIRTCGDLARVLRTPPMLSTCVLCRLNPLIKRGNGQVLRDAPNFPALGALINDHEKKYRMPPSLAWTVRAFVAAKHAEPQAIFRDQIPKSVIRDAGIAFTGLGDADG